MMADLAVVMWAFLQQLVLFIPSALAFVPRGVSLKAQNEGLWYVLGLALVIGVARVLAGLILYRVSDWIHDKVYARRQSWLGIKRTRLERVHQKLNEHGGWWAIFTLWALPIVPGTLISLGAGFVLIKLPVFITATYVGSVINALIYLLIGYYGLQITLLSTGM